MDPYVLFEDMGSGGWAWLLYGANNRLVAWNGGFNSKAGARKAFNRTREIMTGLVWEK